MSAHILLNLLDELGKRDKMRGLPSILSLFRNKFKEAKSATMKFFEIFYFLFKSFVKVELSYVFTINMFENCTEK